MPTTLVVGLYGAIPWVYPGYCSPQEKYYSVVD